MEGAPFAGGAADPDPPAMDCHYLLGDAETETRSARPVRNAVGYPEELVKDHLLLLGEDPLTGVRHEEFRKVPIQVHPYADPSFRGKLDGVVEEIDQHLGQLLQV